MTIKKKNTVSKIKVSPEASIKEALKKIGEVGMKMLFVCDKDSSLIGSLSDGDIRRRVLKIGDLQEKINYCFNRDPVFVISGSFTKDDVRQLMIKKRKEVIPVVDKNKKIVDILCWMDLFEENISYKKIDIPVVIMAGGKGERLGPFTKILPKPLMPVGEQPLIEILIDRFNQHGVDEFYITLNFKGNMVKTYFDSVEKKYKLHYIWEEKFLGTAASLSLLPSNLANTFIVSNCDVIVDVNYADLLKFHINNKDILTVVGSIQHHKIPYGVIRFEKAGKIQEIREKPEFDLTINTGVYVISKKALSFIPQNKHFDMTDFIQALLDKKENVSVYPVSQTSYVDIGQWEEYKKYAEKLI